MYNENGFRIFLSSYTRIKNNMPVTNRHGKKAVDRRLSSGHKKMKEDEDQASKKPGSPSNKKNESEDEQKGDSEQNEGDQEDDENEGDQIKSENEGDQIKTKGEAANTGPADAIKTIVKIFPSSTKNDEGYYIADIRVLTDHKKKPFSISDSLDFKLENMLEHISNLSKASQFPVQKEVKDAGGYIDASKLDINNYMKHDTTEFLILPRKYSTPAEDAKAKKKEEKEAKEEKAAGGHLGGKKYSRKTKRRVSRTRKEHRKKNI
jgi:hypothetical protein